MLLFIHAGQSHIALVSLIEREKIEKRGDVHLQSRRLAIEPSAPTSCHCGSSSRPSESQIAFERLFPTSVGKANSHRQVIA